MSEQDDIYEALIASCDIAYCWDLVRDKINWFGISEYVFGDANKPEDSKGIYRLLHAEDRQDFFDDRSIVINRQFRILQSSGRIVWIHERAKIEYGTSNRPAIQRGVWRVIDSPVRDNFAGSKFADRDELTGALKRPALLSALSRVIDSAKVSKRPAACLVVGVDRMSFVNDAIGTDAGDAVLKGTVKRLESIVPNNAVIGRAGGDTFAVVLPEPFGNEMEYIANTILEDFRNAPIVANNTPLHITVSIGGVRVPAVTQSANEAMIFAEQAVHMASNSFVEYIDNPARIQENRQFFELSEKIKRAFKEDSFRLAYQPIVKADTGEVSGYEVLVRMFDDEGKPISAAAFVPLIEQMGLAKELDRLIFNKAIRDLEEVPDLRLAINVSGVTASDPAWSEYVKKLLENKPSISKRIIIEITETAALENIAATQKVVETLNSMNIKVSLDDFGAGATSIRYLRELAISIMKIDKDLLKDLLTNKEQQHLVIVLIELARGLGIETVAEGIETAEVAEWLRYVKVDYMQGYYFGKPSLERPSMTIRN
ncbi:MAG: EAL domain-containing protein [Alphaproteobacteria bacterium]|nr:EAL domain-containing protein [Alphaproteobacteria bacterium]MCL2505599.1 EAL domain-containing protein [Alphaproteobacteria bacterium]